MSNSLGMLLDLFTNIRVTRKKFGTTTLAYLGNAERAVPETNFILLSQTLEENKLECLSLENYPVQVPGLTPKYETSLKTRQDQRTL